MNGASVKLDLGDLGASDRAPRRAALRHHLAGSDAADLASAASHLRR
jgi:hypothetical protein